MTIVRDPGVDGPLSQKRQISRTTLEVTSLGLGCAGLAGLYDAVPEDVGRATVQRALDAGINYLDTAPQYGFGRSEHLVGEIARKAATRPIVSTKVGRLLRPVSPEHQRKGNWVEPLPFAQHYDYSYDGIMRSLEDSLQRLGLDRVDILNVHDIGVATHGVEQSRHHWQQLAEGGYRALRQLQDEGVIKAIGLGVNEWEILMQALDLGEWNLFLLAGRYTLLDRSGEHPLLARCMEQGTSVVIGGPFNSGVLVGRDKFNYRKAPDDVVAMVAQLQEICQSFDVPLAAAALQFPLRHKAVISVIPGPQSPAELDEIIGWSNITPPAALWEALDTLQKR